MKRSLGWMGTAQAIYFLLQFGSSVVLARLLSPYDTGVFAIALTVVGLLGIIQATGLNNYIVREPELADARVDTAFTINLAIAAVLAVATFALGLFGQMLFSEPGVRNVLAVLAATPIIAALGFLPNAMLERENNFRSLALVKTGASLAATATTVTLAVLGFRFMSLAYGQVVLTLVTTITTFAIAPAHRRMRLSLVGWREISSFGVHMLAVAGASNISSRVSELMLGKLLGLSALGLFSRASSLYNMLWSNVHIVIARVVFVDFARLTRGGHALRERYKQVLEILTAVLWPAFAGLAVLAGPVIQHLYGPRWTAAATPLSVLCIAAILLVSVTMTWELFVVAKETGRQARLELIRSVVGLCLFVGGCYINLTAAAIGRLGEAVLIVILYRPHVLRITGSQPREFLPIYRRSLVLTAAAITPAIGLMLAHRWSSDVPLVQVLGALGAGGACWLTALHILRHTLLDEIRMILSRRRVATQ